MSSAGVQSWTLTAADNTTINGIAISENCPAANINNAIRQAMSSVMQELVYQGADISASVSMSLAGVDCRFMAVTGSASIIHVGTGRAGLVRNVIWNSPSTLVNSANIICDGAANIVTSTYDMTMFTSLGSGAWRAVNFPASAQTINTNDIVDQAVTTAKIADVNVTTGKLANNAVTFAKMQAITDGRILGASGSTAIAEISLGAGLTLASNVLTATGGANQGTFTPVLVSGGSSSGYAYSLQEGQYWNIGSLVFIRIAITLTNNHGAGDTVITGLPYTVNKSAVLPIEVITGLTGLTGTMFAEAVAGGTTAALYMQAADWASRTPINGKLQTTASFVLSGCYLK